MNISVFFFVYLKFLRFVGFGLDPRKPTNKDSMIFLFISGFCVFFPQVPGPTRGDRSVDESRGNLNISGCFLFRNSQIPGRIWCMDSRVGPFRKALLYFVGELYV